MVERRTHVDELTVDEWVELKKIVVLGFSEVLVRDKAIVLESLGRFEWNYLKPIEVRFDEGIPLTMPSGIETQWLPSNKVKDKATSINKASRAGTVWKYLLGLQGKLRVKENIKTSSRKRTPI